MLGHFEEFEFASQDIGHPLAARLYVPERITPRTGLTTLCHGWGANRIHREHLAAFLDAMDLFAVSPEYRDSGFESRAGRQSGVGWNIPYEFGKLQAIDTLRAVHAALERYPINRQRLFLIGGSGGGHVVLQAMAFAPNTFAVTVALAPVSRPTDRKDVEDGTYRADPRPGVYADMGPEYMTGWGWQGVALGDAAFPPDEHDIRNCQRPEHVAALRCKVILVHGTADDVVDPRHSLDMAAALVAARKRVSLHLLDGESHDLSHCPPNDRFKLGGVLEQFAMHELQTLTTDGNTDFDRGSATPLGRWSVKYVSGEPVLVGPEG